MFYHHEDIYHFLCKVHGTVNDLLKEVQYTYDSEELLYLAGARVLGLLSKLVSAPLWRLIESPGHILDINVHYHTLVQYFDTASTAEGVASDFYVYDLYGNSTLFPTPMDENDKVLSKNVKADDKHDICICFASVDFVFVSLFGVNRPTRELFTHIETSPWTVKGCKF